MTFIEQLKQHDACEDALEWVGDKSLPEAWATCQNGDWMLWLLWNFNTNVTDKHMRLMAVRFAREVQHMMIDKRSIQALEVAERYANGEATDCELRVAARAAARVAARAAAWAARAAAEEEEAVAGARAGARAGAAREAARAGARAAAWTKMNRKQASIIREIAPTIQIL